jgi:hypothetical protein
MTREKIEKEISNKTFRDQIFIAIITLMWVILIIYANSERPLVPGFIGSFKSLLGENQSDQSGGLNEI